jgi:hypothetical protein
VTDEIARAFTNDLIDDINAFDRAAIEAKARAMSI